MDREKQLRKTINASVVEVLDRLKVLSADDRQAVLIEHMEHLCFDNEPILIVPKGEL